MKKLICTLLSLLMIFLGGCTVIYDDYYSSVQYIDNNSAVESVISRLEAEINSKVEAGEATVSTTVSTYYVDSEEEDYSVEAGKNSFVIDSDTQDEPVQEIVEADINTTGEKPLYYTYLTETQKRIYRIMKTAAENMQTGFFSVGAAGENEDRFSDIAITFRALSNDNPQIFWLPNVYIMTPDGSAVAFSHTEKGADYMMTPQEKHIAEQQLKTMVDSLVAKASELGSRFEKELFFHDWLCSNVNYGQDGTNNVFSAYGALVNGVAVCEGYSRAMQLLCDSVGIPCTVISGKSNGVGHMWNIINPGDGWYHVDVTWDDDSKYNYIRHAYFNLTDTQIKPDHTIYDAVEAGKTYIGEDNFNLYIYTCNSQKYNYFIKKNLIFTQDTQAAAKCIAQASQNGNSSLEVLYTDTQRGYEDYLNEVNLILKQNGYDIWMSQYSYLGESLVVWW